MVSSEKGTREGGRLPKLYPRIRNYGGDDRDNEATALRYPRPNSRATNLVTKVAKESVARLYLSIDSARSLLER